jgi:hypothetical protein
MGGIFPTKTEQRTIRDPTTQRESIEMAPEVRRLYDIITPQLAAALEARPLVSFTGFEPEGVAALTPEQQQAIGMFTERMNAPVLNAPEAQGLAEMQRVIAAAPGESPATQAVRGVLERYKTTRAIPAMMNELSLAGQGRSGAVGEGVADIESGVMAALAPSLQQEQADRRAAVERLFGIGTIMEERPRDRAAQALEAAEARRQISQAMFSAAANERARLQDLATALAGGVSGAVLPAGLSRISNVGTIASRGQGASGKYI